MVKVENWIDIGQMKDFSTTSLKRVTAMNRDLAVSLKDGKLGAVSNACNHVGGPLGDGRLDGDYIICPWHNWKFHRCSGVGEPGFEKDCVPAYPIKVENGRVFVNLSAGSKRLRRLTNHIRCRAKSNVLRGHYALPEFRHRRWTPETHASQARTISSIMH